MPTKKVSTVKSQKGSLKNNIVNMEETKLRELVVFSEAINRQVSPFTPYNPILQLRWGSKRSKV